MARSKASMWWRMTASARGASPSQIACSSSRVLGDGVVEPGDAVEREEPDPQRQRVVLVERRLDERVVGAAVDVAMDALVELDQRALVAPCLGERRQLGEERARDLAVVVVRALGREPGGEALEREPRLREAARGRRRRPARRRCRGAGSTSTSFSCASVRSASRTGVRPRPSRSISSRSLTGATRRELERDDQLADAVVRLVGQRPGRRGLGLVERRHGGDDISPACQTRRSLRDARFTRAVRRARAGRTRPARVRAACCRG